MNKNIKKKVTPKGKTRYTFSIYIGRDPRTGSPKQVRRSYESYETAEKAFLTIQSDIANGKYSFEKQERLKFKDVYEQWFNIYADSGVKESTFATTNRMIEDHVLPAFGNTYVDRISIIDCQRAVNKWRKDAPRTYKKYVRYAKRVLKFAIQLGLIENNPMENVIFPSRDESPKKAFDYYNKADLKTFLNTARKFKKKAYAFFFVLAYTGLRSGEALTLEWSDIDFNKKTLSVKRTASKGMQNRNIIQSPKTSDSARTIFLDNDTLDVLTEWRKEQQKLVKVVSLKDKKFVFNGWFNNYPANVPLSKTAVTLWNTEIAKKAHVRHIRIHDFRHTHASLLFDAGASMQDIKDRLGHSSVRTTEQVYTHLFKSRRQETTAKFSEYMGDK